MRKIIFTFSLIIISAFTLIAQPPRPTRPTRPDPNTGQSKPRPSRDDMWAGVKTVETLIDKPFIFSKGELQVSGDDVTKREAFNVAIEKSDAVIKEYEDEVSKFLASNPSLVVYENKLKTAINKAKGSDSDILLTAKEFKNGNSLGGVYYLQKLYLYKGFLQGVTRIYPEDETLKDYLKKVTEAIDSYGSREKFMDKMESNNKAQVKNMKMIPASMSDPKVEAMVKNRYEATFKEFKVTKVNITNQTWIIEKNDLGIPLYKRVSVSIAVKNAKGECGIGSANVRQDYQGGGSYSEAYMYLPSDVIIVPCENLK